MHTLPDLPYEYTALEPYVSKETLEFHHDKHHAAYVTNLNNLVPGTEFEGKTLEEIINSADAGGIYNNAAQVWNHTFYFAHLGQGEAYDETSKLASMINDAFGSYDAFVEKFSASAVGNFGSGWTWLVENNGKVEIVNTSNAGCPLDQGVKPVMTIDVWEHAYYVDKRNARPAYVADFWNIVNWRVVEENLG